MAIKSDSTIGAKQQMQQYDQYTQAGMGANPAETMQKAQAAAAQTAQSQSDLAVQQAMKAARTGGAMQGQAALAGAGQAANAYGQAQQAGQQQYFDTTKLGATLGAGMSGRLAQSEESKRNAQAAAAANATAQRGQNLGVLGSTIGMVGGIAGLFSDKNLKDDIKPAKDNGLDKIGDYEYKYKDSPRQERGIIAQELEETSMAPAVMDTPDGKMIDTRRLTTMNTGALSGHEKRLKDIERLVKGLSGIKKPEAKK